MFVYIKGFRKIDKEDENALFLPSNEFNKFP